MDLKSISTGQIKLVGDRPVWHCTQIWFSILKEEKKTAGEAYSSISTHLFDNLWSRRGTALIYDIWCGAVTAHFNKTIKFSCLCRRCLFIRPMPTTIWNDRRSPARSLCRRYVVRVFYYQLTLTATRTRV
ncbi:hypothetical protein GWI33_019359 [Rhynchophorus ferrugineus]|uniref:Uncharacterized protein n=1 Tax=Rhynchophorus ferrugineus TaxID=354439 RepID=A0A834HRV5_RHYFE|nr:hypothetical protein GWI33_019359 [Rhynchophorus ferrugineus]